ncbi:uncharacterized protein ACRADG_006746 [Cochliomyia hominivorax]
MAEETNCLRPAVPAPIPGAGGGIGEYVWTHREPLMHLQKYTPFFRLIDFVEKTRTKRFYEPAERFEILMSACILRMPAPFCQNRRFPEDYFANLSIGPVADAFDRLIAALDIPSPQLLSQMNAQDWDSWKKKFYLAMADIRKFSCCTDLDKLADIGIYNRHTFEQRFNMQWHD